MSGLDLTTKSVPFNDFKLNGGLNSTGGPLSLQNNESSDLQNIDFDKFGSILQRKGYTALNTSAIANAPDIDGLHWFEYDVSGTLTRKLINVSDGKFWKMDDLDGTWDNITGGLTITAKKHCDFDTWRKKVFVTNGTDVPFEWDGSTAQVIQNLPTNLTDAKFNKQYNNFLFLGNVIVNSVTHNSRIYWSDLNNEGAWTDTSFIDIAVNDGQEITGLKVLADRLIIFKTRSIYNLFFTGDADIPFILPGGGKSKSSVGCVAPFTIQEINNGIMFLSHDGFYFFDGNNSLKVSDRITTTLLSYNTTRINQAVSLVQKDKNRYWCSLPGPTETENDKMLVWDYFNNAWSVYDGLDAAAMTTVYVDGDEEKPYWGDYAGFVYESDVGNDDFPLNVRKAIVSFYYTNWRNYQDLVDTKDVSQLNLYYEIGSVVVTFSYSYDFENGDQYSLTKSFATSADQYGSGLYGTATYAAEGGATDRFDLRGSGKVVRFKFSNSIISETWEIHGFGTLASLWSNV